MTAPYCAECHEHVAPDLDHVVIEATLKSHDGRSIDDYMLHTECYHELEDSWVVPA
jgi:hypothetical protein